MKKNITILLLFTALFCKGQTYTYQSELINWTGLNGSAYDATSHTLFSNSAMGDVWVNTAQTANAYAQGTNTGEWLRFTIPVLTKTKQYMFGLSAAPLGTSSPNFYNVTYLIYTDGQKLYISFIQSSAGNYFQANVDIPQGDVKVDMVVTSTTVTVLMNNALVYTFSRPVAEPLYAVASLQANSGQAVPSITNATISYFKQNQSSPFVKSLAGAINISPKGAALAINPMGTSVSIGINYNTVNQKFSFTLPQAAMTSAGLYSGDTLKATLWSLQYYSAGRHDTTISGYGDNGEVLPDGNYTAKVLSNNVTYAPYGTWMNNSDSFHGSTVWRGELLTSMTFLGSKGYVNTGYDEAQWTRYSFDTNHIHQKIIIGPKQTGTYGAFSCTDGHYIYWQEQANGNGANGRIMNYTYATDPNNNNAEVIFANGVPLNMGGGQSNSHPSIIDSAGDLTNNTPRQANGLAVQKNGNYLFISRPIGINVVNKTTGALVRTLNITDVAYMVVNQSNDNELWAASSVNSTVRKFPINSDGTLGSPVFTITMPTATVNPVFPWPTCFDVSPDGGTIAVIDQGRQQIHGFGTANGTIQWTLGRLNGYYGNVLVSDTAFMFGSDFQYFNSFVSYAPNGTLWVADAGNNRYQHFSTSRQYLDNIAFLDRTYTVFADGNDSTAIYVKSDMVKVNAGIYPAQKGWKLMKNYKARMPALAGSNGLQDCDTWPNGRIYSTLPVANSDKELVELQDTGLRHTGILAGPGGIGASGFSQFDKDGNMREYTAHYTNGQIDYWYWAKNSLTGFDANNNPTYSGFVQVAKGGASNSNMPAGGNQRSILKNGNILAFDADGHTGGFHLGMVKPNSVNSFLWQNQNSTFGSYIGEFPKDNFDIGNGVSNYAGGMDVVAKNDIIYTNYHGENWKQFQTAMLNSYDRSGLEIGQFGVTGIRADNEDAPTWLTGNAQNIIPLNTADGGHLIVQNDESKSGGLLVIKASGLNSVRMDSFPVVKMGITPTPPNITELLAGFPVSSQITTTTKGRWTFSNASNLGNWLLYTNAVTADRLVPDLYMHVEDVNNWAHCNLPYLQGNNWEMYGMFQLPDNANGRYNPSGTFYFDIKDTSGRSIVHITQDAVDGSYIVHVNNVNIYTDNDPDNVQTRIYNLLHYMDIKRVGPNLTFTMFGNTVTTGIYDPSADIGQPNTLSLDLTGATRNGEIVGISKMKFNNAL